MKYIIEPIHPGRYWFTLLDNNDQILSRVDGGSAYIMLMLSELVFKPEHAQYQRDQRASSDQLASEVICDLHHHSIGRAKALPKPKR